MSSDSITLEQLRNALVNILQYSMPSKAQDALSEAQDIIKKLELFLQENEESNRLASIYRISQSFGSSLELDQVLVQVVDAVIKLTGAERGFLLLRDEESEELALKISRTAAGTNFESSSLEVSQTVIREVIKAGKTILATNAQDDPRFSAEESVIAYSLRSVLCAPLLTRGETIGVIYVDNRLQEGQFSYKDLDFLNTFAVQAAIAIEQARLYEKTQRQLRDQTILRHAGEIILSSLEKQQVLDHLAEQLVNALDVSSAYILIYDTGTKVSKVVAEHINPSIDQVAPETELNKSYQFEEDNKYTHFLHAGVIHHYHLDDSDIGEGVRDRLLKKDVKTVLVLPIQFLGKTVAMAVLWESRQKREFTPNELSLCQGIAQQAAFAIENARLFELAQQEINERKRAEEKLRHEAYHDVLTGLPNRALFNDRLNQAIERGKRRENYIFGVLFLDLDNFKVVNDSLGHRAGDEYLKEVANRLGSNIRKMDTVARIGGDEFVILIEEVKNDFHATDVADRIQKLLSDPVTISGRKFTTTASIGIVLSAPAYETPDEILRDADIAMYRAKEKDGGRYEIFDGKMREQILERLTLEAELKEAIKNREFRIHYQPIFNLATDDIIGLEALVRWQHPEKGLIPPISFIPLAEETGLIVQIERWVLRESCRQVREWQERFSLDPSLILSVNLSRRQLEFPDLITEIEKILEDTELKADNLSIEITESSIVKDLIATRSILDKLRGLGIRINMDDFGTGYSSLSFLSKLPVDVLKIDRSFVNQIESGGNTGLIKTIISMGHDLGLNVVAEGIETAEQLAELRALDCELGQGFYFAKPMDAEKMEHFIREYKSRVR